MISPKTPTNERPFAGTTAYLITENAGQNMR